MPTSEQVKQEATPNRTRDVLLLEFLREHDAECPVCKYNLRGLTRPVCPECEQDLVLTVGATRLRLAWLLIALAPGFFSGIAACFLSIPTTGVYFEDGVLITPLAGGVIFGWLSGIFALLLAFRWRNRFLAQPRRRARGIAILIWLVHFAALVAFFFALAPHI